MAGPTRLELATSGVTERESCPCYLRPIVPHLASLREGGLELTAHLSIKQVFFFQSKS